MNLTIKLPDEDVPPPKLGSKRQIPRPTPHPARRPRLR